MLVVIDVVDVVGVNSLQLRSLLHHGSHGPSTVTLPHCTMASMAAGWYRCQAQGWPYGGYISSQLQRSAHKKGGQFLRLSLADKLVSGVDRKAEKRRLPAID